MKNEIRYILSLFKRFDIKYWIDFDSLLENPDDILCKFPINISILNESGDFSMKQSFIKNILYDKWLLEITDIGWNIMSKKLSKKLFNVSIFYRSLETKDSAKYISMNNLQNKINYFFVDELIINTVQGIELNFPRHITQFKDIRTNKTCKKFKCYTSIVGDLFHIGHINLLYRCKQLFDYVIVGLHSDQDVSTYKRIPYDSYNIRRKNIINCKLFDEIFDNAPVVTDDLLIDKLDVDYVVAGIEPLEKIYKIYTLSDKDKLHLIPRTSDISTTELSLFL